jgi:hypothetical protein
MKKSIIILFLVLANLNVYAQKRYAIECKDTMILHNSELRCIAEMGKTEKGGNNTGLHIKEYHKFIGLNYAGRFAYCAMGQCFCYQKDRIFNFSALANNIYAYFVKNGIQTVYEPKKHDFIVWKNINNSNGHIGRVKQYLGNGWVLTYEFNTSPDKGNQRDGDGNYIKKRNIYHILGRMKVRGLAGFYHN